MRTRNQAKRQHQSTGEKDTMRPLHDSGSQSGLESINDSGTLTDISRESVGKLLKRVNKRGSPGLKKQDSYLLHPCDSIGKLESESKANDKQVVGTRDGRNTSEAECFSKEAIQNTPSEVKVAGGSFHHANPDEEDEMNESDWEDGSISTLHTTNHHIDNAIKGVTIDFDASPDSAKRKPIRRASVEEKELAELVHKVHLLCLIGRGRLIDSACNEPLIQASLLSLLPISLLKISEVSKLTANALAPLVNWFHNNFHIRSPSDTDKEFHSALAFAIETREGTPEEVAALSVALFRALNVTTRFVSILDVASLKPDADKSESISQEASRTGRGIFNSSTLMVARPNQVPISPVKQSAYDNKDNVRELPPRGSCKTKGSKATGSTSQLKDSPIAAQLNDKMLDSLACEAQNDITDVCITKKSKGSKRKGDIEFEMELEMALSATSVGVSKTNIGSDVKNLHCNSSNLSHPLKRMKKIRSEESSSSSLGISTAVGSRKVGAPLYWAEVYCSGENLTGKWVHVDAVNAIIDGEEKVEAAAAACKTSLRYAVGFAGHGAKDVTRRYCMKWYKIASQRINSIWWDAVLAPLKELESGATGAVVHLKQEASNEHKKVELSKISDNSILECPLDPVNLFGKSPVEMPKEDGEKMFAESSMRNSFVATRASLEDMELETRALTEPLPTNQLAYKNHQLYALERWLTKYQILHPKGPVLGLCSGHPVYPRTCVQTLHTKERWLREGLQIKANELPVKVLKRSLKLSKAPVCETDDYDEGDCGETTVLFGKWQTEPLSLPCAVDGIVPKNDRGQVDVWSEKCLPPGTVHLRFPRMFPIAKRLEIDFAPAMVGFEFRNGRSIPVYDGIVVCAEFRDAILEAYAEEEERREAGERKRKEAQAISRWYQLLSSIVTRQRLNNSYGDGFSSYASNDIQKTSEKGGAQVGSSEGNRQTQENISGDNRDAVPPVNIHGNKRTPLPESTKDHEHVFLADDQIFDEESSTRTKRCRCGFSIEVEEL